MSEQEIPDAELDQASTAAEAADGVTHEAAHEATHEAAHEAAHEAEASEQAVETDAVDADAIEAEAPAAEPTGPLDPATNKHWYIIHSYSGFENKVAESIRVHADAFGYSQRIGQLLIPTEEVFELRNGKKVTSKRMLYPGYVLIEMEMDDNLWHAIKNTPRVTGFVGGGNNPVPLTANEVNSILYRQANAAERPKPKLIFERNETVRITEGPFTNFSGKVDDINPERNTLRVMVTIFGRSTPVELDFEQVEKIA